MNRTSFIENIFKISSAEHFSQLSMELFAHQAVNCAVYKDYLEALKIAPSDVKRTEDIPFLPITFFRHFEVTTGKSPAQRVFSSSGTTGMIPGKHYVRDLKIYECSFQSSFRQFYGKPSDLCIIALLPAYLEREGSSLVYMADVLIRESSHSESGFFLHRLDEVADRLEALERKNTPTLLLGVTFALLDLAELYPMPLKSTILMETGGMKGRRNEITRAEVHQVLKTAFGVRTIHSEYGMTELLSQAYSSGNGIFTCPPWMKVLIRETTDPLTLAKQGMSGGMNIIDLANMDSCAFIATQDLGRTYPDNSFEVLGRFDHADVRGCNLLSL